jgi:hypothetical protein
MVSDPLTDRLVQFAATTAVCNAYCLSKLLNILFG